jgi:hypothetical protein
MTNQEQITKLAELAYNCHQIERHFKELPFFASLPYANVPIERAVHHLEHARMFAGDLLRLAVLKEDYRKELFFNVSDYGGRFTGSLQLVDNSMELVKWAKKYLRELFNILIDDELISKPWLLKPNNVNGTEWLTYKLNLLQHLKEADQCLGLWLGEIYEAEKERPAPPSNAKEVPTLPLEKLKETSPHLSYFQALEKQSDEANTRPLQRLLGPGEIAQAEATFNAIMADLGQPRKMGGVKGPWSYLETIDLMDKNMADGVFGYSKSTIEEALRRHLALPLKPETLKP